MTAAFFLSHFWHYFYFPSSGPWYGGNVWGNVMVVAVLAPLGWIWSRTRFWPIRPVTRALHGLHAKVDHLHDRHDEHTEHLERLGHSLIELHHKLDQLGGDEPEP